jgi:hypothetical protein
LEEGLTAYSCGRSSGFGSTTIDRNTPPIVANRTKFPVPIDVIGT